MHRTFLLFSIFLFMLVGCTGNHPQPIQFQLNPYFFDAGAPDTELAEGKLPITPNLTYTPEFGYGLTTSTAEPFYHPATEKGRTAFLVDGIKAPEIGFKADLPSGEWWLTIWMEFGMEDSLTTRFYLQGKQTELHLQSFSPEAEPRTQIEKTYRVFSKKVYVGADGLEFKLQGNNDEVRLLGFSLIPNPGVPTDLEAMAVYNVIKEAGRFDSQTDLTELIGILDELGKEPQHRNFAAYWKQQLEILREGEKFFNYRGWSHRTDETGMGLFDHIHQGILAFDGIIKSSQAEENLLYERALWYNARLLYWLWLEGASYREKNAAFTYLGKLLERHPDEPLIRMYNGHKIDIPDPFDNVQKPENAPDWAFAQWEMMNRLKHYADWWVNEQQSETGEFGGKFGDDVEILRWWSPLILSGDQTVFKGWKKLADGVYHSSKVYQGYAKTPSDVEHSSEFISDTAPLMVLYTDEAEYVDRLAHSANYFRNLWTGYNNHGNRFFKSAWFSSTEIQTEPPKNRDVAYNTRAVKAVRYYAWKTQHEPTIKALTEWADAWYEASQRTDKGKPIGLFPASIEYPTGNFNGSGDNWYTANMYWAYFDWSGAHALLDQLLFTWTITGNEKYLKPIIQHLELVKRFKTSLKNPNNPFKEGTEQWAAYKLGTSEGFWNVIGTWRLLTENNSYDDLILEHGTPYIRYRLTGNEEYLVEGMQPYLDFIRYNEPMFTSEVIHTDRVFIKEGGVREAGILQAMVTGYGITEGASPYVAVSWEEASRDLTFLVTHSDSTSLDVELYSFSDVPEKVTMRLWQLRPGSYQLHQNDGGTRVPQHIEMGAPGARFELTIKPHTPTSIHIKNN